MSIWRFPGVIGRSWTGLLTATLKFSIICSITITVFHYNYHFPSSFELWWYNDSNLFVSHPPLFFYGVQTPGDELTAQENEKCAVSSVTLKESFFPWASDHPLSKCPTVVLPWIFQPASILLLGRSWAFTDVAAAKTLFAVVTCKVDESIHLVLWLQLPELYMERTQLWGSWSWLVSKAGGDSHGTVSID